MEYDEMERLKKEAHTEWLRDLARLEAEERQAAADDYSERQSLRARAERAEAEVTALRAQLAAVPVGALRCIAVHANRFAPATALSFRDLDAWLATLPQPTVQP